MHPELYISVIGMLRIAMSFENIFLTILQIYITCNRTRSITGYILHH